MEEFIFVILLSNSSMPGEKTQISLKSSRDMHINRWTMFRVVTKIKRVKKALQKWRKSLWFTYKLIKTGMAFSKSRSSIKVQIFLSMLLKRSQLKKNLNMSFMHEKIWQGKRQGKSTTLVILRKMFSHLLQGKNDRNQISSMIDNEGCSLLIRKELKSPLLGNSQSTRKPLKIQLLMI